MIRAYNNLYKPTRAGEAENDAYIQKAIENYQKAAERDPNQLIDGALAPTARELLGREARPVRVAAEGS